MVRLKTYGKTLDYKESKEARTIVRQNAVKHALTWNISNDEKDPSPEVKFGYELEIHKVYVDEKEKKIKLDLSAEIDILNYSEVNNSSFTYQPENVKWIIESKLLKLS